MLKSYRNGFELHEMPDPYDSEWSDAGGRGGGGGGGLRREKLPLRRSRANNNSNSGDGRRSRSFGRPSMRQTNEPAVTVNHEAQQRALVVDAADGIAGIYIRIPAVKS